MTVYTVSSGDTLSAIAKKNNISLDELLKANPDITDPSYIDVGQKINITKNNSLNNDVTSTISPKVSSNSSNNDTNIGMSINKNTKQKTYTVNSGDTLSTIAKKYNISLDELLKANLRYNGS